jgi:hypothetical protein
MTKYRLDAEEFAELSGYYDTSVINYAYGLRLLQLCVENASDIYGKRPGFEDFVEWLNDLSQHVDEGLAYLEQYIDSTGSSDDAAVQEDWDGGGKVSLTELPGLLKDVAEGLETTLDESASATVAPDLSDEEEERLEEEVSSVAERVMKVGYETYHYLIGAQYHWEELGSSNTEKSRLLDVSRMFGEKPTKDETTQGSDTLELTQVLKVKAPGRYRAARADASVGSIRRQIERVFGLPEGSVSLRGPDGKALRSDARIAILRRRWDIT